jgi:hypothetical protein
LSESRQPCQAPADPGPTPSGEDELQSKTVSAPFPSSYNPFRVIRDLESRIDELDQRVAALDSRLGAAATQEQVHSLLTAQSENIIEILNTLDSRLGTAATHEQVHSLLEELSTSITEKLNILDSRVGAAMTHEQVHSLFAMHSKNIIETLNTLNGNLLTYADNLFASSGRRDEVQALIKSLRDEVQSLLAQSQNSVNTLVEASNKGLREMLNAMNAALLAYTERRMTEFADESYELLMRSRLAAFAPNGWASGLARDKVGDTAPPIRKDRTPALEDIFASLARRAPAAWPIFKQALNVGTRSYEGFPVGSCSVKGHREAERFGAFIAPYLRGYVLDVGCGPQPQPSYLRDYPVALIRGIDPISKPEEHPFEFASAVAEDIPWQDASFDIVCSGTTLDHFFLLDVALKEIHRVMKPGGHFVAWISEAPGSKPYDPYRDDITAADEEHLFHIDRAWFLPMMRELGFEEVEILALSVPFKHLYMSFRRPSA